MTDLKNSYSLHGIWIQVTEYFTVLLIHGSFRAQQLIVPVYKPDSQECPPYISSRAVKIMTERTEQRKS